MFKMADEVVVTKKRRSKPSAEVADVGDESFVDKSSKWEEQISRVEAIANPLASRKLAKRLYKVIKKGRCSDALGGSV